MRFRLLLLLLSLIPLLAGVTLWLYLEQKILPALPDQEEIEDIHLQVPLRVVATDGSLIAEFGEKRRTPLRYEEIPQRMIGAILAAEDERFFEHPGIDATGIVRAAVQLILTGEKRQGGSTITMQMARNFFLTREKSWERKIKELFLALRIEQSYSKEEILTLYLNKVFLGHRAYGIGAAFQVYYGTTADQATLPQIAMIVALRKAPSAINPIRNPQRARERRNYVLDRMLQLGQISAAEHRKAQTTPITARLHHREVETPAPYAAEMVRAELVRELGEEAYTLGITVTTTIRPDDQHHAITALQQTVIETNHRLESPDTPSVQGAIVAIDPHRGGITALSGGTDFTLTPFNRVTQSQRQIGSTIKPLLYSAALRHGKSAATLINDAPLVFKGSSDFPPWKPSNSSHQFHGPTLLEDGLILSRNLTSIRLLQEVGFRPVLQQLKLHGFPEKRIHKHRDLTLAIGTMPASPLELATAYTPFANGGWRVTPYLIRNIRGATLKRCELCRKRRHTRVLNEQVHYLMDGMMKKVVQWGTAREARKLNRKDIAGKTGTSNQAVDTWFAGYHPDLVVVTWIGHDQPQPLGENESGGHTALPMWIKFMEPTLKRLPERYFSRPKGLIDRYVDLDSGKVTSDKNRRRRLQTFRRGLEPPAAIESVSGLNAAEMREVMAQFW